MIALLAVTAAGARAQMAEPGPAAPSSSVDTRSAETELRLMEMEAQLRRITGQYEEAMYRLTQVNRRLERSLEDMEYRVQKLEHQLAAGGEGATGETAEAADQGAPDQLAPPVPDTSVPADAGSDGSVQAYNAPPDYLTVPDPNAVPAQAPDATPETAPDRFLEGTTPEEQFAAAFTLLRRNELEGAENAFRAFLALHPTHALAANAQYWLGKTYFARGNYDAAARVMLEGFQAHADSDKGPDMLLHLGLSLSQLGQNQQACAAFDELGARYPNADIAIAQRATNGRRAAGCS